MTDWSSKTSVIVETIQVAKEYLENELAKYDTWERLNKNIKPFFGSSIQNAEGNFKKAKNEGIGQNTLLRFLGSNWKQWQIQKALNILRCFKL